MIEHMHKPHYEPPTFNWVILGAFGASLVAWGVGIVGWFYLRPQVILFVHKIFPR